MMGRQRKFALRKVALATGVLMAGYASLGGAVESERVGYAYSLESGELIYKENHETRLEDGQPATARVTYRDPEGRVLAVKSIDYRKDQQAPDFRLDMRRIGYQEGLRTTADGREVFYQPVEDEGMRRAYMDNRELVADAGFDRLIEKRFQALKEGQRLTFSFLVPSRLEAYSFQAAKVGEREVLGQPAIHVRLEPANLFFRWVAGGVEAYYHKETGKLLRYQGLSNLRDPAGNNPRVRIDFPGDTGTARLVTEAGDHGNRNGPGQ